MMRFDSPVDPSLFRYTLLVLSMSDPRPSTPTLRQNPANQPWIVMKYGGTSVGKFLETIASDIVP